jgi:hypothetical protein
MEQGQRAPTTVRLIGTAATNKSWREALIREGLPVPVSGPASVNLADLRGQRDPVGVLDGIRERIAGIPVVAIIAPDDPLPTNFEASVTPFRLYPGSLSPLIRALKLAAHRAAVIKAAAVRFEALAKMGHVMPGLEEPAAAGPAVLLAQPAPEILPLLNNTPRRRLVAALSSGQTLRLLETDQASALVLNVSDQRELRLPVLKLIRRQSELSDMPVAVLAREWTDETAAQWLNAGADILGRPDEIGPVLDTLSAGATRFRTMRVLRRALTCLSLSEDGEPSPTITFERLLAILDEHRRRGDDLAYGLIELKAEPGASDNDMAEAGVYMSMAASPVELIHKAAPNLYFVAMPYADRFYARRTMRTMQTLIEDLKFGEEPMPVLMSARQVSCVSNDPPTEVFSRLHAELASGTRSNILA